MRRTRVYVAGPYTATGVAMLDNMRVGMRLATELVLADYAPFCPWLDYHYQLMLRPGERLVVSNYYDYSVSWLLAADCVLMDKDRMPKYNTSRGTQKELCVAFEAKIPVYTSIADLIDKEPPMRQDVVPSCTTRPLDCQGPDSASGKGKADAV